MNQDKYFSLDRFYLSKPTFVIKLDFQNDNKKIIHCKKELFICIDISYSIRKWGVNTISALLQNFTALQTFLFENNYTQTNKLYCVEEQTI